MELGRDWLTRFLSILAPPHLSHQTAQFNTASPSPYLPSFITHCTQRRLRYRCASGKRMAEEDGLLALQGLHSDLIAFSENRLQDIERLVNELDSRIEEFRELLDKKGKADASRKKLQEGASFYCRHFVHLTQRIIFLVC